MQFGRVATPDGVSFAIPPLTARSARLLAGRSPERVDGPTWLRLGAPAWSRRDWLGKLYPTGSGPRDWLRLYAAQAGAIELNASFYAIPDEPTIDTWIEATPPAFRFCPKVPRAISHELGGAPRTLDELTRTFVARMERLGARLGPALLQLAETFTPAGLRALEAQLARFPDGFAVAVEVRHAAWFARGALRDDLVALLERRGAAAVITDVAGRRDACHGSLTAPIAFVRWVGEAGHASDGPRLEGWVDRLAEWRARGLADAYLFVHQPDDLVAPEGMALAAAHARARGIALPAITLLTPETAAPRRQLSLF